MGFDLVPRSPRRIAGSASGPLGTRAEPRIIHRYISMAFSCFLLGTLVQVVR
jgi:hypothetical protein